jgi:hypothetical protein
MGPHARCKVPRSQDRYKEIVPQVAPLCQESWLNFSGKVSGGIPPAASAGMSADSLLPPNPKSFRSFVSCGKSNSFPTRKVSPSLIREEIGEEKQNARGEQRRGFCFILKGKGCLGFLQSI